MSIDSCMSSFVILFILFFLHNGYIYLYSNLIHLITFHIFHLFILFSFQVKKLKTKLKLIMKLKDHLINFTQTFIVN